MGHWLSLCFTPPGITNYVYQRYRPLVADDLLSPRKKNIFQPVLVSNGTHLSFFLAETTSPLSTTARRTRCFQVEDNTQQDVDLNKTALFTGFPVNAVKFTFW